MDKKKKKDAEEDEKERIRAQRRMQKAKVVFAKPVDATVFLLARSMKGPRRKTNYLKCLISHSNC